MANEPLAPPGAEVVAPYLTRRNRYQPRVDDKITIDLPGEKIRAEIKGIVTPDIVLVEILGTPVSRAASDYEKGMLTQARRAIGDHEIEIWRVISENELRQQEARARLEEDNRRRAEEAERARVAAIRKRDLAAQAAAKAPAAAVPAKQVRRRKGAKGAP